MQNNQCGIITQTNGVFKKCIDKFPALAIEYRDNCIIDACLMGGDSQDNKCPSLTAFAEECAYKGERMNWRSANRCRKC